MIYAIQNEQRTIATPGARGTCPSCDAPVIAKCGKLISWHWAHVRAECDPFSEPMTQWHIDWQNRFPAEWQEVVIKRDGQTHRADVQLPSGKVIEFQHSPIGVEDIAAREAFYGDMVWVFDCQEAFGADRLFIHHAMFSYPWIHIIRWSHARKSIFSARQPVLLQIDAETLLRVNFIGDELSPTCALVSVSDFLALPQDVDTTIASWVALREAEHLKIAQQREIDKERVRQLEELVRQDKEARHLRMLAAAQKYREEYEADPAARAAVARVEAEYQESLRAIAAAAEEEARKKAEVERAAELHWIRQDMIRQENERAAIEQLAVYQREKVERETRELVARNERLASEQAAKIEAERIEEERRQEVERLKLYGNDDDEPVEQVEAAFVFDIDVVAPRSKMSRLGY